MKHLYTALIFLSIIQISRGQTPNDNYYITNGMVNAVAQHGNTIYVGGNFTSVGPNTGHAALVDNNAGEYLKGTPNFNGPVYAIVADGSGGWYVGGNFTYTYNTPAKNLVHIKADNTLDNSFAPTPNLEVNALCIYNNILYAGGGFNQIGGINQQGAAAFDLSTGHLTAWNPKLDNGIDQMAAGNGIIYLLGNFGNAGGQPRSYFAAVDATTGNANSLTITQNSSSGISAMSLLGDTLYIGGNFSTVNGVTRDELAAVDVTTGTPTSWAPTADNLVTAVYATRQYVYIGGGFDLVSGQSHSHLAAIDPISGNVASWSDNIIGGSSVPGSVNAILALGDTVYFGGYFTQVAGQTRNSLAAVNVTNGNVTNWDPETNQAVFALAFANNWFYAGGNFTSLNTVPRNYIAALDATTGLPTNWVPNINGNISALATKGDSVIMSGSFNNVNGVSQRFVAILDSATGSLQPWAPNPDGQVEALTVYNNTIYIGGGFGNIAGGARYAVAAIDGTTGNATAWNANLNQSLDTYVSGIQATADKVYMWGQFSTVGSDSRLDVACVDAGTGLATAWNPATDGLVESLALSDDKAYLGGYFYHVGGQSRVALAQVDTITGAATTWNPGVSGSVKTIATLGGIVYAGGTFIGAGGALRNNIAAIDESTGLATGWNSGTDYAPVNIIVPFGSNVIVGGSFTQWSHFSTGNLVISGIANTLPLTLLDFTAAWQNNNIVQLNWETANEINTSHFIVQRSGDGNNFDNVTSVTAKGLSIDSYMYNDTLLKFGDVVFYRLQMFDKDGKFTYSQIIRLTKIITSKNFIVYPNPAHSQLGLHVTSAIVQTASLRIIDMNGRVIQIENIALTPGDNNVAVGLNNMANGVYIAQLIMTDKKLTNSFLKN